MEHITTIVNNINRLFSNTYTCSSFNALKCEELLQIVINILNKYCDFPKIDPHSDKHRAVIDIISCLKSLQYKNSNYLESPEFNNGLNQGSRRIIYSLLEWLLINQEEVEKRYYLFKYSNLIDIPLDLIDEPNFHCLYMNYTECIEQFMEAYRTNIDEKQKWEDQKDLEIKSKELKNITRSLSRRLDIQENKLQEYKISAGYVDLVKDYCNEKSAIKINDAQLIAEQNEFEQLNKTLIKLKTVERIKGLEELVEKSDYNNYNLEELKHHYMDIEADLNIYESIYSQDDPNYSELDDLSNEINIVQSDIKNLRFKAKNFSINNNNDFFKHAQILCKKKEVIGKEINRNKLDNEILLAKIDQICALLGGDVLKGKNLKHFVDGLRTMSVDYKSKKSYLKAMNSELVILENTLSKLHDQNPDLKENLDKKVQNKINLKEMINSSTKNELKTEVAKIMSDMKLKTEQIRELFKELDDLKLNYCKLEIKHKKLVDDFDKSSLNIRKIVRSVEERILSLHGNIQNEQKLYEELENKINYYNDCVLRYSQGIIESSGGLPYTDALEFKFQQIENENEDLKEQLKIKKEANKKIKYEIDELIKVKDFINLKLK